MVLLSLYSWPDLEHVFRSSQILATLDTNDKMLVLMLVTDYYCSLLVKAFCEFIVDAIRNMGCSVIRMLCLKKA